MITPLITMPGGWELIVIVLLIVLLFGARKLPELARGTGQALRIFKAETKGLTEDGDDSGRRGQVPDEETDGTGDSSTETKHSGPSGSPEGDVR